MRNLRFQTLIVCVATWGWFAAPFAVRAQNQVTEEGFGKYFGLESPYESESWPRHFRVGALVGLNLKAQFSASGTFAFSNRDPGATGVPGVDHNYDDGFVRVDATDNDMGATYYWSYNNASQYDGGANRLSFHRADSYTTSSSGSVSADAQLGFDTAYGGHLWRRNNLFVGWEFGFGFLPIKIEDQLSGLATVTQTVHWYDTSNLGSDFFITDGNTLGSYTGTEAGPGAKLNDIAHDGGSGGPPITGALSGTRTLDVTLYNFRLGPTLHWELHPRIAVAVSAGAAMGLVTGDLRFNESVLLSGGTQPNNSGSFSDTEISYGGYVAGKLMYHAVKNGDFYVGVQYMPLGSATFSGGGRQAKLNMSGGVYISAGINWPF